MYFNFLQDAPPSIVTTSKILTCLSIPFYFFETLSYKVPN